MLLDVLLKHNTNPKQLLSALKAIKEVAQFNDMGVDECIERLSSNPVKLEDDDKPPLKWS